MAATIDTVFFDAIGTLVHHAPSFPERFAAICAAHGTPVDADAVRTALEQARRSGAFAAAHAPVSEIEAERHWRRVFAALLEAVGVADVTLVDPLCDGFADPAAYALFDDVPDTLARLRASGLRLGVVSNCEAFLDAVLVRFGVHEAFDCIVISTVVGIAKPDTAIYRLALAKIGTSPHRALHVGDSPVDDVEAARAVGMHAVLLDRQGRHRTALRDPCIGSLQDLPAALAALDRQSAPLS